MVYVSLKTSAFIKTAKASFNRICFVVVVLWFLRPR